MKIIRITPGLGNQMFQYSLLLNYKLKGEEIYFDLEPCRHSKKHNSYELNKIFGINVQEVSFWNKMKLIGPSFYINDREITFLKLLNKITQKVYKSNKCILNFKNYIFEKESSWDSNFNQKYLELKGDKYVSGYFNSWKYFNNIEKEVRESFTFPNIKEEDRDNFEILKKIKDSESVSIHVRRGDYLNSDLDICDNGYYERTSQSLIKELKIRGIKEDAIEFFIFSDDTEWCRNNLNFLKDYETIFVDWNKKADSYKDMQLMSECRHNIISNSTFSWWGGYLNKNINKIVIAPKYWFKGVKTSVDRCEKDWFLI